MRCTVFIATSLDGFIARPNGDLDWLPGASGEGSDGEDYGFKEFMDTVDVMVMGRLTYEKVLTFGDWPFGDAWVVVLSSRPLQPQPGTRMQVMSGTPEQVVARLEAAGARHAYVDGGATIRGFLDAGLVQRMIITRVPVLIGRGVPLFGPLERDVRLRAVTTRQYPSGMVQTEYAVLRQS